MGIPDRWLMYKPYGEPIKDTKLLAFKVPLKEALNQNLEPGQRFTPSMLLEAFPNLKYIIDLTNTYRYYNETEFAEVGVKYEKVKVPGQKVPELQYVKRFFQVMDHFLSSCAEGELIGIHCTHGINRTGYLICRYLIQQLGWEVDKAIKELIGEEGLDDVSAFGEARGYAIERELYVSALRKVPLGEKIETPSMNPTEASTSRPGPSRPLVGKRVPFEMGPRPMGPPSIRLPIPRRIFEGPFPPQQFPFGGPRPRFGPMPPPAGVPPHPHTYPPPPPPPPPPPIPHPGMFGPRGCRFGPRLRPPMPPPFSNPSFPQRKLPRPPVMDIPPNIPQVPIPRLPPLPPPPSVPPGAPLLPFDTVHSRKRKVHETMNGVLSRQDFTLDTFEENLLEGCPSKKKYPHRLGRGPNGPQIDMFPPRPDGMPKRKRR